MNFSPVFYGIFPCYPSGERLSEPEVEDLMKKIDLTEDLEGNVKYEGKHNFFYASLQRVYATSMPCR